uniref:Odorant receptor n=1 Tax=Yemma signatus TaxID=300820 RepID=A0A385H6S3_9HEMI|nr:odorant receptor [Yemma signatus]
MFIFDWLYRQVDYINGETDEEVEIFVDKTYFYYMRVIGFYPYLSSKPRIWFSIFHIFTFVTVLIINFWFLLMNSIYFFDLSLVLFSQEVHFLLLTCVASCILIVNTTHRRDFSRMHRFMMNEYYDYNEGHSTKMDELKEEDRKEKFNLLLVPLFASLNGAVVLFASRFIDTYYGTFDAKEYDINFLLPFPCRNLEVIDTSQGLGFYLILFSQLLCITIMLPLVITGGGLILVFVLLDFIRQLKFLLHKIESSEERALRLYAEKFGGARPRGEGDGIYGDEEFLRCYEVCVNKCIDHHAVLLSVFENIDDFMHFNFFQCFLLGSVIIALSANCINTDSVLPGTVLANASLCLNEIGYMYLLSIFGQRISDLSDDIRYYFYNLKWYNCPRGMRLALLVIQEQASRTLAIMGAKILPVNLDTFSRVMNSAYSYYNILNAV